MRSPRRRDIGHSVRVSDSTQLPQEGWYPDPAGTARWRFWDGAQWTVRYSDPPSERRNEGELRRPRVNAWRVAIAALWVVAIAASGLAAIAERPAFADVQSDAWIWLVIFTIPAIIFAVVAIWTPSILLITAALSATSSVLGGWGTMRDTHSTAAVGVLTVPFSATAIVGIGWLVDLWWQSVIRRRESDA